MQWYLFNDHTVTRASADDIEKAFGGISTRGYYSSMYSRYGLIGEGDWQSKGLMAPVSGLIVQQACVCVMVEVWMVSISLILM